MAEPVYRGPGKPLYEAYRQANARAVKNGGSSSIPPWKKLKPKTMTIWNETARLVGAQHG